MDRSSQAVVCHRCGRGFVRTPAYRNFLARRGIKVRVPVLCMTCFLKTGPMPKQKGEVKWFDSRKRYGFIVSRAGEEVFVHQQQILAGDDANLHEGQDVRFHVHDTFKGPEALNVEAL
jgi:CspA family cold shock protein